MENRLPCPRCGGLNPPGVTFCGQCFGRLDPARQAAAQVQVPQSVMAAAAATSASATPAAPALPNIHLQSFPPQVAIPNSRVWTPRPEPIPKPIPASPPPIRWRWPHLWLFGFLAWGVPLILNFLVAGRLGGKQFLSASLTLQILGYFLAAGAAVLMVKTIQKGDWGTLGISFSDVAYDDLGRGILFGLGLFVLWIPVGFVLGGGHLRMDALVYTLIGHTNGAGLLLAGVVLVLGAPLIEETYYRGMLYEKLARKSVTTAVVVTSLLFVAAHGAILIPPLLLLAFALAHKRKTKSLWYTIGGHAAWNFAITCLGAYLILGGTVAFTPPDKTYTLTYPSNWQRSEKTEKTVPNGKVELALVDPSGAEIEVVRYQFPAQLLALVTPGAVLPKMLEAIPAAFPAGGQQATPQQRALGVGGAVTYETSGQTTISGPDCSQSFSLCDPNHKVDVHYRFLALLTPGSSQPMMIGVLCESRVCADADRDFDSVLERFTFAANRARSD